MIAPFLFLAMQGPVGPNEVRRELAAGDKDAVLMGPPETVCGADAKELAWTADGNYLVVTRAVTNENVGDLAAAMQGKATKAAATRQELVVWGLRSKHAAAVLSIPTGEGSFDAGETMAGTDRVLIHYSQTIRGENGGPDRTIDGYSMLVASTGTLTRLTSNENGDPTSEAVRMSPVGPLGALRRLNADKTATMRFFGPDGRLGASFTIPQKQQFYYDRTGAPGYVFSADKDSIHFQRIDPASGMPGPLVELKSFDDITYGVNATLDLTVQGVVGSVPTNASAPGLLLKVKGGKPDDAGVVSTDGKEGVVSPKGDAVAYVSQGSVMVRGLARIPRAVYDATMLAARKALAMSQAKQVALGLMMFAADMDDVFPNQGDYGKVDPYLKDSSLRDSFTYTFGGGNLTTIKDPSGTPIGYVPGPGGRAVAYADGHVRWVPDSP